VVLAGDIGETRAGRGRMPALAGRGESVGRPDPKYISIKGGSDIARDLLEDLFAKPRRAVQKWSKITGQTAQVRLAYPGQHLASVITGMPGAGTAARGVDLADGSEVKSCSRADQLGTCTDCDAAVLPYQETCPECVSEKIKRKTDSHWILSIRTEQELEQYLEGPRLIAILFDRDEEDPSSIRARAWEIWTQEERHSYFAWKLRDYFENNYLVKVREGLSPAPLNLHPLKRDFFLMNPLLVFDARIRNADSEEATVEVDLLVEPTDDRSGLDSERMPASAVSVKDRIELVTKLKDKHLADLTEGAYSPAEAKKLGKSGAGLRSLAQALKWLDEEARALLVWREARIKMTPSTYRRRRRG